MQREMPEKDLIEDPSAKQPWEEVMHRCKLEGLNRALGCLTDRESEIIRLRFGLGGGEPLGLEPIGMKFKLTRERIRQIEEKALGKLHSLMTDASEGDVLES